MILEDIVKELVDHREMVARQILNGLPTFEVYREKVGEYKAYSKIYDDIFEIAAKLRKGEKL